jgi:CheY-like chemotaxis protein
LQRLNGRCRPIQQALGGADALAKLEKGNWQVLFLDRRLPDLDAEELIAVIERRFPGTQVVLLDSEIRDPQRAHHPCRGAHRCQLQGHQAFSRHSLKPPPWPTLPPLLQAQDGDCDCAFRNTDAPAHWFR